MSDVIKFYPLNAAADPDAVLEQAVGNYGRVIIVGYDKNGWLDLRSDTSWNVPDLLFAIELVKMKLMRGDYSEGDDT